MQASPRSRPSWAGAPLEELLTRAELKYRTRFETVKIGPVELSILQIANMESQLEAMLVSAGQDKEVELPFWAKIWPTSILLGYYVQRLSGAAGLHLLEIGAGLGICGLCAARQGLRVIISDNNEDALLFTQINILQNQLQDMAEVANIDFTTDTLDRRFDIILGSEVLYQEKAYQPLNAFLSRHINHLETSEVILAKNYQTKASRFFEIAQKHFAIQEKVMGYKEQSSGETSERDKHLSQIYRLRPKIN